jgi:G protein-coupled receptor GPR1
MLLIQSDLIKSICFIAFPLVRFVQGSITDQSTFCQVSGFFLTVGIEASDIASLILAIHAALSVIYASSQGRDWSLYKYRGIVYAGYILFPLLIASLAFIGGGPAFQDVGAYCYLRVDKTWPRMALSWIPRYIIGTFILVSYICLYMYVILRLRRYRRRSSIPINRHGHLPTRRPTGVPTKVPRLDLHGLIESEPQSTRRPSDATPIDSLAPCYPSNDGTRPRGTPSGSPIRVSWAEPSPRIAPSDNPPITTPQDVYTDWGRRRSSGTVSPGGHLSTQSDRLLGRPRRSQTYSRRRSSWPYGKGSFKLAAGRPEGTGERRWSRLSLPSLRRLSSLADLLQRIRGRGSRTADRGLPPSFSFQLYSLRDPNTGLERQRNRTRSQTRLQFIYPIVYVLLWVFPFITHVDNYDYTYDLSAPIWLYALSIASLSAQGVVDSLLFCFREYPWRHRQMGFWQGLGQRLRFKSCWLVRKKPGRTREETNVDSRFAIVRRDAELEERHRERSGETGTATGFGPRKGGENWWEAYDKDDEISLEESWARRSSV